MAVYRQPGADFFVADPLLELAVIDQVDLGSLSLTGHDGIRSLSGWGFPSWFSPLTSRQSLFLRGF